MEINIYDAKTHFSKLVQILIDETEEEIIITKHGKAVIKMVPISGKVNKRIGIAKKEIGDCDLSLETLNSIPVEEFDL